MPKTITTTTGESLTCLCAAGDNISSVGGEWTILALHTRGESVTFFDLSGEVFALYRRHSLTEVLLTETEDQTRRIYPAGQWPVLTVQRTN